MNAPAHSLARRNMALAMACWADMPTWVRMLADACDDTSQKKVAVRIGYQPAVVNQVLQNKYKGSLRNVELAVSGAFEGKTVNCPVLGDLPVQTCLQHQRAPFALTNPQRTKLWRACRSNCPHSAHCKDKE